AAKQAHRRTGVAAVEYVRRLDEPTQASTFDAHALAIPLDVDPEVAQAAQRRATVSAGREIADARFAVADRVEQRRAVRNRFVAGHAQRASNVRARADRLDGRQPERRN